MLRAVIPWGPESAGDVTGTGTVAAGAPTIQARFTLINTAVANTAAVLPSALAGAWFVVTTDGAVTGRLFAGSGDSGYVAGVGFDNATPYQIVANKAVLMACAADGVWYGVALG